MAQKKLFDSIETKSVYDAIAETTAEPEQKKPAPLPRRSRDEEPTEEEIAAAREQGKTQGRKGVKAVRINMAFASGDCDNLILSLIRDWSDCTRCHP